MGSRWKHICVKVIFILQSNFIVIAQFLLESWGMRKGRSAVRKLAH